MEMLFIPAGTDVQGGTTPEWRHFANLPKSQLRMRWAAPEGKGILNVLKSRGFSREAAQEMVGSFNGKLDLRGSGLGPRGFFWITDLRDGFSDENMPIAFALSPEPACVSKCQAYNRPVVGQTETT